MVLKRRLRSLLQEEELLRWSWGPPGIKKVGHSLSEHTHDRAPNSKAMQEGQASPWSTYAEATKPDFPKSSTVKPQMSLLYAITSDLEEQQKQAVAGLQ